MSYKLLHGLARQIHGETFAHYWEHKSQHTEAALAVDTRTLQALARCNLAVEFGGQMQPVLGHLCRLADRAFEASSSIRTAAVQVLGEISKQAAFPEVIAALLDIIRDQEEDYYFRVAVAEALGEIADPAAFPEVIAALLDIILDRKENNYLGRVAAAKALGEIGKQAAFPEVIAALLDIIRDRKEDRQPRYAAAEALGKMQHQGMRFFLHVKPDIYPCPLRCNELAQGKRPFYTSSLSSGDLLRLRVADGQAVTAAGILPARRPRRRPGP